MPLASFPTTFDGIEEGVPSPVVNTADHQQYVGRTPDLEFYDPDGMMPKKKRKTDTLA